MCCLEKLAVWLMVDGVFQCIVIQDVMIRRLCCESIGFFKWQTIKAIPVVQAPDGMMTKTKASRAAAIKAASPVVIKAVWAAKAVRAVVIKGATNNPRFSGC